MAAHDLRNPLNAITGLCGIIVDDPAVSGNAQLREYGDLILKSSEYMLYLMDNLLDVSKIQRGKLRIHPEPISLEEIIPLIIRLNRKVGEYREVALDSRIEPGLPDIWFDRECFKQVLNNLIANAFKFSKAGTSVTVEAGKQGDLIGISVIDRGMGIRKEELSMIFGEFEKGSSRQIGGQKGYGLGLAICKKIVEAHGCEINVESELGKGSRFFFRVSAVG